jgi:ABC-type lipoprotein release transport system permease subunit
VVAALGVVFAIPIGVAGRELWTLLARSINVVPETAVTVASVVLVGIGTLIFANVVAAIPARRASRTPTALVVRAE